MHKTLLTNECTKAALIMYTKGGGRGEGEDIFNGKGGGGDLLAKRRGCQKILYDVGVY